MSQANTFGVKIKFFTFQIYSLLRFLKENDLLALKRRSLYSFLHRLVMKIAETLNWIYTLCWLTIWPLICSFEIQP